MKKVISVFLAVSVLLCSLIVCSFSALASEFSYTISNGKATICGYYGDAKEITIPEKLGNYPVVAIDDAAFRYDSIEKVVVSPGIKSIGKGAFEYCSKLKSISLPKTLTSIGESCFDNCESLTNITIPSGIKIIPQWCFAGCTALTTISIPDTVNKISYGAFEYCSKLQTISIPSGVTAIPSRCFAGTGIFNISFLKSIKTIGECAFEDCLNLTSVAIPSAVETIPSYCFYRCENLQSVKLGNNVKKIKSFAFSDTKIEQLNIPKSVDSISSKMFSGYNSTSAIKTISVSKNNKKYSSYNGILYNKDKTKLVYCPRTQTKLKFAKSLKSIGSYAFNSSKIKSITIPKSVTSIGSYAFSASNLTKIVIPGKMKKIPEGCFAGCSKLTYVKIPNSITTIGDYAFSETKVSEFDLPNSLKTLGCDALMTDCGTGFTIPESVKNINRLSDPEGYAIDYIAGYKGTIAEKQSKKEGIKFIVAPAKGSLSSVSSPSKAKMKVKWKKVKSAAGYQIQLSTSSTMSENTKAYTIKKGSTTSATISKLTKGKKYYVQVRAYKKVKVNGKNRTIYGSWSATKSIKIKK